MQTWSFIRFLHLAAIAFFVGGQLLLVFAVTPVVRRSGDEAAMREVARRFGIGSALALAVAIGSGIAMASHFERWDSSTLQLKLGVLVLVLALLGVHIARPKARGIAYLIAAGSVLVLLLGVKLAHG